MLIKEKTFFHPLPFQLDTLLSHGWETRVLSINMD
jgi:hypothetical protein